MMHNSTMIKKRIPFVLRFSNEIWVIDIWVIKKHYNSYIGSQNENGK